MNKIEFGDCREIMRRWADEGIRVQTCVTSPPYFGLRDYGVDGQIGLEQTPDQYIAKLVEVFREVRRVLADNGTLWLNIGDSYAANGRSGLNTGWAERTKEYAGGGHRAEPSRHRGEKRVPDGLKQKDLIGIPWMLAFALRADGWFPSHDTWRRRIRRRRRKHNYQPRRWRRRLRAIRERRRACRKRRPCGWRRWRN